MLHKSLTFEQYFIRPFWLGLKPIVQSTKQKQQKKRNHTGSFTKEQGKELSSNESDLESIQISSLRMKTLEENTWEGKQESDSNIEVDFTVNK